MTGVLRKPEIFNACFIDRENLAAAAVAPETVILHQYPRMQVAPSLSPYALKLETYLRLAKISYQVNNAPLLHFMTFRDFY